MSASVRPSIPRPSIAKASAPPPPPREKMATLDLEDDDIVGIAVAPIVKKSSAPPPPPSIRSAPPPPPSHVAPKASVAPPASVAPVSFPPASIPAPIGAAPMAMPSIPPPAPVANVFRLSVTDPTDVVFEGMYGLAFAKSTGEAAEMCAETLAKALGARAVVIHRHDLSSRELRAIGAHGDGDFDIIGSAETSEDDLVASAVICNQKSVTMKFDGELPAVAPKRLRHVGAPRTVVAAPAMSWGRCLAIVEVIDADERYAARVADSATYVAEQLARFLLTQAA
ncbi:MAG: hypothetical protein KIT84_40180 [Labilithrix sp.]|nr:hypothetical protein [Labilithrix sp.]MCW5817285.1 hypothetical protein [Labilithrix sp.]